MDPIGLTNDPIRLSDGALQKHLESFRETVDLDVQDIIKSQGDLQTKLEMLSQNARQDFDAYLKQFNVEVKPSQENMVGAFITETKGVDGCAPIHKLTTNTHTQFHICGSKTSDKGETCILESGSMGNYCRPIRTFRRHDDTSGDSEIDTACGTAGKLTDNNFWRNEGLMKEIGEAHWCSVWENGIRNGPRKPEDKNTNRMEQNHQCVPTTRPANDASGWGAAVCNTVHTCKRIDKRTGRDVPEDLTGSLCS